MPAYPEEGALRGGHIPSAQSVPWARAAAEDGTFRPLSELREIYFATKHVEDVADSLKDRMMGDAARSLGRYLSAVGASGNVDKDVLVTHIDAMHTLGLLGSRHHGEREGLIKGLQQVVDKKLARLRAARCLTKPQPQPRVFTALQAGL